jgi:hypothetical protein
MNVVIKELLTSKSNIIKIDRSNLKKTFIEFLWSINVTKNNVILCNNGKMIQYDYLLHNNVDEIILLY